MADREEELPPFRNERGPSRGCGRDVGDAVRDHLDRASLQVEVGPDLVRREVRDRRHDRGPVDLRLQPLEAAAGLRRLLFVEEVQVVDRQEEAAARRSRAERRVLVKLVPDVVLAADRKKKVEGLDLPRPRLPPEAPVEGRGDEEVDRQVGGGPRVELPSQLLPESAGDLSQPDLEVGELPEVDEDPSLHPPADHAIRPGATRAWGRA